MKSKLVLIVLSILIGLYACNSPQQKDKKVENVIVDTTIKIINVTDMTCSGCEATVEKKVSEIDGVFEIKADHKDSMAIVKYDANKVSVKDIEKQIKSVGYSTNGERN